MINSGEEDTMSFLAEPSEQYKYSYIEGIQEFQKEGKYLNFNLKRITEDFGLFLEHMRIQRERDKTAPGRVPNADFWLIDNNEFVGRISLRYTLNDYLLLLGGHIGYEIRPSCRRQGYGKEILRLALLQAKQAGLKRVLVTCDENNPGSKKIIEYNGGIFVTRHQHPF